MAIFRIHKTGNYTVMSNEHLIDKRLSIKAKGLLSIMLSLPEDWDYSVLGLTRLSKDGKDCILSTLAELRNAGYVRMTQTKSDKGHFASWCYDVFESSQNGNPNSESPHSGNPNSESPHSGNPQQLNTNSINIITDSRIVNNTPTSKNTKKPNTKENTPSIPQGEVLELSLEEELFEAFRKAYKGSKRGHDTEFRDFTKKHKDWKDVVKILLPAYERQEAILEQRLKDTGWRPEPKNLKTYLNQRCWETEENYEKRINNQTASRPTDAQMLRAAIDQSWGPGGDPLADIL